MAVFPLKLVHAYFQGLDEGFYVLLGVVGMEGEAIHRLRDGRRREAFERDASGGGFDHGDGALQAEEGNTLGRETLSQESHDLPQLRLTGKPSPRLRKDLRYGRRY
jgi:hypothetical protein